MAGPAFYLKNTEQKDMK